MKVYIVEEISPNVCECETQCLCCTTDYRRFHKVFSTLKKASEYVKSKPKVGRFSTYYECDINGIEVDK